MRVLLTAVLALWASACLAQDYVTVPGKLTDEAFYRAVACGAVPDGACKLDPVRWPEQVATDLTISIFQSDPAYPTPTEASAALDAAVAAINGADAGLALTRLPDGEDAHITIYLSRFANGGTIEGIGLADVDGDLIEDAYFRIYWDRNRDLTRGIIILSTSIDEDHLTSVMLEEVAQSLGLLHDIRSPWYETRSIFSEDSNLVTGLTGQDVIALRRHYPPSEDK